MLEVNIKEARSKLSSLLDKVERGEEIIITRRGKKIARLASLESNECLPSLKKFRDSIKITGTSLSKAIINSRLDFTIFDSS